MEDKSHKIIILVLIAVHISLVNGERSKLAELAVALL